MQNITSENNTLNDIEEIPKGWKAVKLGDVCDQRNEIILPLEKAAIRFIGLEHIESGKTKAKSSITDSNVKSSKFRFLNDDILYGKLRPYLDKAIIADTEGICSTDLLALTPNNTRTLKEFLIYVIHSNRFIKYAVSHTTGTNYPRTTWKEISNFNVWLPPLPEQQKIAEILSTADEAIQKVDEAITKAERLKKGLMHELLTKGIGYKEFKETEIGRIPRGWEVARISEIGDVKGGKRLPKGHQLVDFKTPYPYIRVVDFMNMAVNVNNLKFLLPETQKIIKQYIISAKDVYISIAGTVGIAGIIPQELDSANLTENAAKLCNLRNVNKKFLAYILNSFVGQHQIAFNVGKATQPKLALFRIEQIKLPLPSLPEQQKISEILSTVDKKLELLGEKREKFERIKKGLMNDLLTGRKRVNIVKGVIESGGSNAKD
jgi:type I restriction enzyme S subunit